MADRLREMFSEKSARLGVVIPAFHGGSALHTCLNSVVSPTPWPLQASVVDNASNDGSVDSAEALFPELHFLLNKTSL